MRLIIKLVLICFPGLHFGLKVRFGVRPGTLILLGILSLTMLATMSLRTTALATVASCQTSTDGGAYAWVETTGPSGGAAQFQEEGYAKMIHSYGSGNFAEYWWFQNTVWHHLPIHYLSTGQTYDTGLLNVTENTSRMDTWDGASPMSNPTNLAIAEVQNMTPYPQCYGPRSPGP